MGKSRGETATRGEKEEEEDGERGGGTCGRRRRGQVEKGEEAFSKRSEARQDTVVHTLHWFHSFNECSMSTVYMLGRVMGARDLMVSR